MSDAVTDALAARGGLTFDWQRRGRRPFWLFFFVVLSICGHAACFYLFQVVYPPQRRELLLPVEVTVLDPRDTLARDVLSRIDDRVVAFDGRGSVDIPGDLRDKDKVLFHPSFESYEPALRELPRLEPAPLSLFTPGKIYLPPAAVAIDPPPGAVPPLPPMRPVISLRWIDSERVVLDDFKWPPDPPVGRPADSDRAVFQIGVDRSGRVVHSLPEQSAGAEMDAAIHRALRAMRFAPAETVDSDWAWVDIRW